MLGTLWVFAVGLMPPLLSLWLMRKTQARMRSELRAITVAPARQRRTTTPTPPDRYYLEGVGYLVGDISCQYNARCGYLRCAVNPQGPCQGCRYYEPLEFTN